MLNMAKRITEQDIEAINEAYLICGTYAGAARAVGCSSSTARKYVISGYTSKGIIGRPPSKDIIIELADIEATINYLLSTPSLSTLTQQEKNDLKNIWKGMNF